jgi:hypothetical protein
MSGWVNGEIEREVTERNLAARRLEGPLVRQQDRSIRLPSRQLHWRSTVCSAGDDETEQGNQEPPEGSEWVHG